MWALLISRPLWSHLVPVALPAAGHEVAAVATRVTLGDELARVELQDLAIPRMLASSRMPSDPDHARHVGLSVDGVPLPELGTIERRAMFGRLFAGVTAVRVAQDTAASGFQPDIEVRECTEMGGYLLAEPLELPCATLVLPHWCSLGIQGCCRGSTTRMQPLACYRPVTTS